MWIMMKRALTTALVLLNSGCAVYYHDQETGADHIWGIGHLATKVAEPEDHKQAVIRQVTLTGFSLGLEEGALGLSLGWDQRQRVSIFDENSSIAIRRPKDGNFFCLNSEQILLPTCRVPT